MKIYAYIITHDKGFAPNPFHGFLTLATCMPHIRRSKNFQLGDWLMGISSAASLGRDRLIYAAQVNEIVTWEEYSSNPHFAVKKTGKAGNSIHGDNIYYKDNKGKWQQRPNHHHFDDKGDTYFKDHDTNGKNVLIAKDFWYFGDKAPKIPTNLNLIGNARLKCLADEEVVNNFVTWINTCPKGINGAPSQTLECGASCSDGVAKSSC